MKKSVTSDSTSEERGYKYHLIQFCQSQRNGILDIDIVPSLWVLWDQKENICMVRYPPPPYTKKVGKHLERLVREQASPPQDWPFWNISIKGGAETYEVALRRVEKLKTDAYAFTTDADFDGPTKASKITEAIKKKTTAELFSVAGIDDSLDDDWTPHSKANDDSPDSNNNSESSIDEECTSTRKNFTSLQHRKKKLPLPLTRQKMNLTGAGSTTQSTHRIDCTEKSGVSKETIPEKDLQKKGKKNDDNNNTESSVDEECTSTLTNFTPLQHRQKKLPSASSNRKMNPTGAESITQSIHRIDCTERTGASKEKIPEKHLSIDTRFLLKTLTGFRMDLQANTAAINALHDALVVNRNIVSENRSVDQVEKKYDLHLPLDDQELFQIFDDKLREDDEMNRTLKNSLKQLLDRNNNMTKSVTNILRKFFSRDLATKFTAKKKVEGKTLLKTTIFGSCLIAALIDFHTHPDGTPVNEDSVLKSVGSAISNAKDWEGRQGRAQKK